ncbi:MAG: 30S ribosomal protein S7 [Planctomycetes bacterium]|nr:30S ribosomal protein S7 [Planctomycetota bacterium]
MPKKFKSFEDLLKPDPRYKNKLVGKFINCMMWEGKKSLAQKIFYDALDEIHKKLPKEEPLTVFTTAIENAKPMVEVRSRRIGGANYRVPVEVTVKRQLSLAMRWIISSSRKRKGRPMATKLANELLTTFRQDKESESLKKRAEVHNEAESHKAFAHFAFTKTRTS